MERISLIKIVESRIGRSVKRYHNIGLCLRTYIYVHIYIRIYVFVCMCVVKKNCIRTCDNENIYKGFHPNDPVSHTYEDKFTCVY